MAAVSGQLVARRLSFIAIDPVLAAVTGLALLGLALRLHDIALDPFWKNELFSLAWIDHSSFWLATSGLVLETNPPLHFLLLKLWTEVFGTSEVAARLPSALASAASVPLLYALGRRLGGTRVGLVAAGVLAVTPMQIFYAHEARAYAFLPCFLLLALLGLCRFLQEPVPGRQGLGAYVLGSLALIYSHAIAAFILAALLLALGLGGALPRERRRNCALATLLVLAGAVPQMVAMALQAHSPNIEWMDPFSGITLLALVRYVLVGPMVAVALDPAENLRLPVEALLATAGALLLFASAWRAIGPDNRLGRAIVVLFPLLFLAIGTVVSLERPILVPRVGIWLSLPVGLAAGFVFVRPSRIGLVAGALLAACLAFGLQDNVLAPLQHKPHWQELARDNPAGPDVPLLVVGPHTGPLGLDFYAVRSAAPHPAVPRILLPDPAPAPTLADRLERDATGARPIAMGEFLALIQAGRPVRLAYDDDDAIKLKSVLAGLPSGSLRRYPGVVSMTWNAQD